MLEKQARLGTPIGLEPGSKPNDAKEERRRSIEKAKNFVLPRFLHAPCCNNVKPYAHSSKISQDSREKVGLIWG